jgi:hypothetical protein
MFGGTCTFNGLAVVKIPHHTSSSISNLMRQTDLYRSGKPLGRRNCFELLVKSITAFVTLLASRFLGWVQRARWCTQSRSRMPGSSRLLCTRSCDYPMIEDVLIWKFVAEHQPWRRTLGYCPPRWPTRRRFDPSSSPSATFGRSVVGAD